MFLWACGIVRRAWELEFVHNDVRMASYADLTYFLYGVPVNFIDLTAHTGNRHIGVFFLDAVQVTLMAMLAYLSFFDSLLFVGRPAHPVSANAVAIFMPLKTSHAAGATVRMAWGIVGEIRVFFKTLNLFLWSYAVCVITYNLVFLSTSQTTYFALLGDVAFLRLAS